MGVMTTEIDVNHQLVASGDRSADGHEHAWRTESRHRTSDGWVLYVRCGCGARRIDHQELADQPPRALSRETGGV